MSDRGLDVILLLIRMATSFRVSVWTSTVYRRRWSRDSRMG